jgi:hypothetical protein
MATYEKKPLSESAQGTGIWLGYSASAITLHQTGTSSTVLDEIWIYLSNNNNSIPAEIQITINTNPAPPIGLTLTGGTGLILVIPGLIVCGTGTVASTISVTDSSFGGGTYAFGYVNRITP